MGQQVLQPTREKLHLTQTNYISGPFQQHVEATEQNAKMCKFELKISESSGC